MGTGTDTLAFCSYFVIYEYGCMLHDGVNKTDAAGAKAGAGINYSCYFDTPFVALMICEDW